MGADDIRSGLDHQQYGIIHAMNDGVLGALSTAQLLRRSWKMFRSHLWLFVPLMGFPVCTLVLGSAVLLLLFPEPQGVPLQEAFEHSSTLNEISVVLVFLGSVALLYHVFGVTMWAAGEFLASRDVGMWQAIRHFGGKQARLFWALFLAGLLTRSTSGILPLVVGYGFGLGFPVAAFENLGAIDAIQRGDSLNKGKRGRYVLLYVSSSALVASGVYGLVHGLGALQDFFGGAWFLRPVFSLGLWLILLIPQFYLVTLTVNYFDMRSRSEAPLNA